MISICEKSIGENKSLVGKEREIAMQVMLMFHGSCALIE
jgi:hypothetical protein